MPTPEPSTPALESLGRTTLAFQVVRTERAGSAEESAELQGIPLGALRRTIVVRRGDDDYLFVIVPAGRRFDWPKLRTHLGIRRLTLPDADDPLARGPVDRPRPAPRCAASRYRTLTQVSVAMLLVRR